MKRPTQVLIVEDALSQLGHILSVVRGAGFDARAVVSFAEALDVLDQGTFDVLLTDIHLTGAPSKDGFEGLALLEHVRANHPEILCLAMSSDPDVGTYRKALRLGALHFFRKPILSHDEFKIGIDAARSRRALSKRTSASGAIMSAKEPLAERYPDGLVIDDRTRKIAGKVALSRQVPLVIYGETGTGKEEVAKLVHRHRVEIDGAVPFVAVNCANLTGELATSLLFGHRKGAFTGASETTNGFIGEADGGILFLDEIHILPLVCQQRLLRVLNDGSYERVGETKPLRLEFQVIAASTRDLDDEVESGRFLLDLRMRLTGIDLELPSLRKRLDDLPALISVAFAREGVSVASEEIERIASKCAQYAWKGNIRQLFKVIGSLVVMSSFNEEEIRAENLPVFKSMIASADDEQSVAPRLGVKGIPADALVNLGELLSADTVLETAMDAFEKLVLQATMARHDKISDVAKTLALARSTLDLKRKKHGL